MHCTRAPPHRQKESKMNVGGIDNSRIQAMMAQLKTAATRPTAEVAPASVLPAEPGAAKVNFADALKNTIAEVSEAQKSAGEMGKRFTMGDESVSLSEVMVSMQKASIGFQATVQVRNKLV
jgi:flagellar hook-basal body complex protein FliE